FPAPDSATNKSPFGATINHRGVLKLSAYTLTWNPGGTVGRNPSGRFGSSGALPTDRLANGFGRSGLFPCVTCALPVTGRIPPVRIAIVSQKTLIFALPNDLKFPF